MTLIQIGDRQINIKKLGESKLEETVLDVVRSNNLKKNEVIDYYFKKYKFRPHKKLNGEMSFIECAMKHDYDLLTKYVKDLKYSTGNYNTLITCISGNKMDLLRQKNIIYYKI